jgi:hypothetical protein
MSILQMAESFGLKDGSLGGNTQQAFRQLDPKRAKLLGEAAEIWQKAWNGDRLAALLVNEAMTTSDLFVSATGDLLDRELLASYGDVETVWSKFVKRTTVRNFKPKKFLDLFGGKTRLDVVPELTEFPGATKSEAEYQISVKKYGRRVGWSWEAGINDDIDELRQIPGNFARAAALTEEYAALELIADSTTGAPNTGFFKSYSASAAKALGYSAFNNAGVNALTTASLEAALTDIASRKDSEGNLIGVGRLQLVVGKALEFTAKRILAQGSVRTTVGGQQFDGPNLMQNVVDLVVHPYLPGNAWFLLPQTSEARPALALAFLSGYETPDFRVQANTGQRVGGGNISPEEGDFEVDGVWYRVRHVTGGAQLDPIHTFASTGATGTAGI